MKKSSLLLILIVVLTIAVGAQSASSTKTGGARIAAHPQASLPPLEIPSVDPKLLPRPPEVIRGLYRYAAEHPDVLSYMPCFCSCDKMGHKSNEDCFVKSRAKNGDVTAWEEHGIACAMCQAVAEKAKQMCEQGAKLSDIRAEVERRYGHITGNHTPTPQPPAK